MHQLPRTALALLLTACAHEEARPVPSASFICPASWVTAPFLPRSLRAPDASLRVLAHAAASGTQNYRCTPPPVDGGGAFAWTPIGPEASLTDCNGVTLGRHFANETGSGAPKWQSVDGSFVVATKVASEPSGETGTVPWLLLRATDRGGAGTLEGTQYVQRTGTKGGAAPRSGCDAAHTGERAIVPYSAEYWFLGR